ncbi:ataxin-3-like protein [Zopfochytrium polystomum]|nr:ataxin-3-like protein [Zopfochytrium polystomum]
MALSDHDDILTYVFHERQEGMLCAQHALNNLLQGPYFTAVDLSTIAQQLDEDELNQLDPQDQAPRESSNYDDTGFFSVQVLMKALEIWNLTLVSINSQAAKYAKNNPEEQDAFILNLELHWFTLRRFGGSKQRWYNCDSMLPTPRFVSETYLSALLDQFQSDGYSVFVVAGAGERSADAEPAIPRPQLPRSEADAYAEAVPFALPQSQPPLQPSPQRVPPTEGSPLASGGRTLGTIGPGIDDGDGDEDDAELNRAIMMSLEPAPVSGSRSSENETERIRRLRLERFGK